VVAIKNSVQTNLALSSCEHL